MRKQRKEAENRAEATRRRQIEQAAKAAALEECERQAALPAPPRDPNEPEYIDEDLAQTLAERARADKIIQQRQRAEQIHSEMRKAAERYAALTQQQPEKKPE